MAPETVKFTRHQTKEAASSPWKTTYRRAIRGCELTHLGTILGTADFLKNVGDRSSRVRGFVVSMTRHRHEQVDVPASISRRAAEGIFRCNQKAVGHRFTIDRAGLLVPRSSSTGRGEDCMTTALRGSKYSITSLPIETARELPRRRGGKRKRRAKNGNSQPWHTGCAVWTVRALQKGGGRTGIQVQHILMTEGETRMGSFNS